MEKCFFSQAKGVMNPDVYSYVIEKLEIGLRTLNKASQLPMSSNSSL
jgi:hypothetical protein